MSLHTAAWLLFIWALVSIVAAVIVGRFIAYGNGDSASDNEQ